MPKDQQPGFAAPWDTSGINPFFMEEADAQPTDWPPGSKSIANLSSVQPRVSSVLTATSDLIPENIALGSSSVAPGGSLSVNWDILNQGTAAANSTSTTEVRITSSSTSAAGTNLVGVSTSALAAGASQLENATLTVPTTPGTYYVWVIADNFSNVTNQSNTSNDLQHSAAFTVTASPPPPLPGAPMSDGSIILASGGSLTTADGVWSFGVAAAGGFSILLNGQSAMGGSAVTLELAAGGHLFADNAFGNWYEWNGAGWSPSGVPPSADGATLLAGGGGNLATSDGIWSFSATPAAGGFLVLRNGQSAAGGSAASLQVAQNGHLFADNAFGNWYEWNGAGWSPSAMPPSPDGTALPAGAGGSLATIDGVWSFGAGAAGGFSILLNGQSAAGGSAASLEVAQNGHLFADNAFGNWYEWTGAGWSSTGQPAVSSDGAALLAGGGNLTTVAGVWSFGAAAAGGFSILLNGQPAAGGSAETLEVAAGGHLFADNAFGSWYEWNGAGWSPSGVPPSADGATLLAGGSGSLATSDGVWSFSATPAAGGFSILRNGQSAAGGSAASLQLAQNGHLFADNAFGHWYEWNGAGWSPAAAPPSPDGTALPAGTGGSLVTSDGVWSFGAGAAGGFLIQLNGQSAAGGSAASLEVAQNGHLFADNAFGNWYEWNGAGWGASADPTMASPPHAAVNTPYLHV